MARDLRMRVGGKKVNPEIQRIFEEKLKSESLGVQVQGVLEYFNIISGIAAK
jgi:hypothetical protein